ncbi:MAG: hypothetical protein HQK56_08825 [Deltaproteobacteria bacterium]|nr:hypothetical protein [Deltaproteobacteria bacterium]
MKVLFYANPQNMFGHKVRDLITTLTGGKEEEYFQTVDDLGLRLRQPMMGNFIAVIAAASREELAHILTNWHFFLGIRIVLILPDREEDTVSKGHSLRPRFMSYADDDLNELAAVLGKMIGSPMDIQRLDNHCSLVFPPAGNNVLQPAKEGNNVTSLYRHKN